MRVVGHSRFGIPSAVAELIDQPDVGDPTADEVVIAGEIAPVHPADLLAMEGRYGVRRQTLPALCGTDGVGRVVAVGGAVQHIQVGDRLPLLLARSPTWRGFFRVRADGLFPLPPGPLEQLSMIGVNPITAWALLHDFADLKPKDWVIQNAANSSVGQAIDALARRMGVRTVGVVRRLDVVNSLQARGFDRVIVDGPDLVSRVLDVTGGEAPVFAIDAVGGEATMRLANAVMRHGRLVTYGLLSGLPCQFDPNDLIFRDISVRGFWLATWMRRKTREELAAIYREIATIVAEGHLNSLVAAQYPLDEINRALSHALECGRDGKVLLRLQDNLT